MWAGRIKRAAFAAPLSRARFRQHHTFRRGTPGPARRGVPPRLLAVSFRHLYVNFARHFVAAGLPDAGPAPMRGNAVRFGGASAHVACA